MSNAVRKVYPFKEIKSSHNRSQKISDEFFKQEEIKSSFSNFGGGGGSMDNYVTRKEFEQFEKRVDDNLKSINASIVSLPERIDEKVDVKIEKMKNTQLIYFIGTIVAITGIAGRIFGLY